MTPPLKIAEQPSQEGGLLPCPFCGGEATISSERVGYRVDCLGDECYARGPWPTDCTDDQAVLAWNARATPKPADPTSESVERAGLCRLIQCYCPSRGDYGVPVGREVEALADRVIRYFAILATNAPAASETSETSETSEAVERIASMATNGNSEWDRGHNEALEAVLKLLAKSASAEHATAFYEAVKRYSYPAGTIIADRVHETGWDIYDPVTCPLSSFGAFDNSNERCREALAYYANDEHYDSGDVPGHIYVLDDHGRYARAALAALATNAPEKVKG